MSYQSFFPSNYSSFCIDHHTLMTQSFIQLLHPLLSGHGHGLCARLCLLPLAQRILGSHLRPPISIWPELPVHCTTKCPKRKILSMDDRKRKPHHLLYSHSYESYVPRHCSLGSFYHPNLDLLVACYLPISIHVETSFGIE